jgi:hypothetical protein
LSSSALPFRFSPLAASSKKRKEVENIEIKGTSAKYSNYNMVI